MIWKPFPICNELITLGLALTNAEEVMLIMLGNSVFVIVSYFDSLPTPLLKRKFDVSGMISVLFG